MRAWRAWYADGAEFSSTDSDWQTLPSEGLVGVVVYEERPYRRVLDGFDWVWLEDGEIRTTGTHPEWGEWLPRPDVSCNSCVKRGAAMPDEAFRAVQREMMGAR